MPKIKVINSIKGVYLDIPEKFEFPNQTSEAPIKYTLTSGTEIELDFDALPLVIRDIINFSSRDFVEFEGVFFNFYKRKENILLTFCVTKIII